MPLCKGWGKLWKDYDILVCGGMTKRIKKNDFVVYKHKVVVEWLTLNSVSWLLKEDKDEYETDHYAYAIAHAKEQIFW